MTVKELIEKLQKIENKELIVIAELWMDSEINAVWCDKDYAILTDDEEHAKQFAEMELNND